MTENKTFLQPLDRLSKTALINLILRQEKERHLTALIDYILDKNFRAKRGHKLKKDVINQRVADKLGMVLSNQLRRLINDRMLAQGYVISIRDGYKFWKDIEVIEWHQKA